MAALAGGVFVAKAHAQQGRRYNSRASSRRNDRRRDDPVCSEECESKIVADTPGAAAKPWRDGNKADLEAIYKIKQ